VTDDYFARCGKNGATLTECRIVDAHAHLHTCPGMPYVSSTADSLIAGMDRLGIDRAHVSSTRGIFGLGSTGNDGIMEAVRRFPDRLRGYITVNPGYPDQVDSELARCWKSGLRAVKIWSYGSREGLPYNHPSYERVFRFADERESVILAHTWGGELDELDKAFNTFRRVRWVCAHSGSRDLEKYVRAATIYDHVYLETCLSACPRGLIEELVESVPLHKIVWGSDQLFLSATQQIGRVLFARISEEQKRAILGENAMALFG